MKKIIREGQKYLRMFIYGPYTTMAHGFSWILLLGSWFIFIFLFFCKESQGNIKYKVYLIYENYIYQKNLWKL